MEIQKKQLKRMIATKEDQDSAYQKILAGLVTYEDNNVEYFSESDVAKRVLTSPASGTDFLERYASQWKSIRNPFRDAYYWLKGELLDLKGLNEALSGRETVVRQQSATEAKKRSDQQELEKLSQGKTTLKSLFKSKSSKETEILSLQATIEMCNKDIEDYKMLVSFLTVYHGEVAI